MISIIIPFYNEEQAIPALLACLDGLSGDYEMIFSDGGSTDRSCALLAGRHVVTGAKGRGAQCNRAAAEARGEILLFLHCDSRIQPDALQHIDSAVRAGARWGCLTLKFDDPGILYWIGAAVSNLRVRWGQIAFGDQAIFLTRSCYLEQGGFPELPLMEDYELSRQLKHKQLPPKQVSSPVITSARRFREGGPLRVAWRMYQLRARYRRGESLEAIRCAYQDVREPR